ncbi:Multidomain esterase [Acaryochloris thomasi RCC1774]|uniref:Multidomain esterase n=1 Tax=Acaryochloris thomasi RCC1774 TaxID=1764569 RepID=A0A2W1JQK7_9CYAN|nr:Multidomain esterase [Acaryochloris thomasi RCC1774]
MNGGGGIDTTDYSEAVSSVNVDLTAGTTTITSPIRLMPLGDSITEGLETDPDGGYRIPLWNSFVSDGFDIDFVGSLQTGPPTIDVDHEGHRGFRIDEIADSVDDWLSTAQPDTILLMIGTNDILGNFDLENAPDRLSSLIDQITAQAPDADLFVSSIAPGERAVDDTQQTIDFNAAIQPIIEAKGGNVTFVDINSQLSLSDLIDEIHPNAVGYEKIADAWYEAIADEISSNNIIEQDTLNSIENVIGSTFRDTLTGNNGANLLTGGEGSDVLTGNGGGDSFVYTALSEGGDTITDFGSDDFFQISAAAFGGGLTSGVALSTIASAAGSFVSGTSPSPLGSSANFLYDTSDPNQGVLRFDSDGTGSSSSSILATLTGAPGLTADQFILV